MMIRSRWKHLSALLTLLVLVLSSCTIKDDFALPLRKVYITAFEVEGMCDASGHGNGSALIDKEARTIELYVSDTVDISRLRITRFELSNDAEIVPDASACLSANFPTSAFTSSENYDTRVNFENSVKFILRTYQEYEWTINVHQVINREVQFANQVGNAVIDPINESVVVYVSDKQKLRSIKVNKFSLGGEHGSVSPDPTTYETYNFTDMQTFQVRYGWSREVHTWRVFVYQTDAVIATSANVFARTVSATVKGDMQNGNIPVIEYRIVGDSEWNTVPDELITSNTSSYSADIKGLSPSTTYEYQVTAGTSTTEPQTFTTTAALQLENASLDDWSISGTGNKALYQPWAEDGECYWDTGNHGATTVGPSNSTVMTENGRTFANLQSKYIVIKFAAGNIFTGEYLKTDGTNGILGFGRPFNAFPTKLQFDYRYQSSPITRTGGDWKEPYGKYIDRNVYENMKGQPDSCQIFIALLDDFEDEADRAINTFNGVAYPWLIRTRPSEIHLFVPESKRVIAYAQMTQGSTTANWQTKTLDLDYRYTDRTPKYIVVVASSSKYGDFFTGGEQSLLQLDDIKLLYE